MCDNMEISQGGEPDGSDSQVRAVQIEHLVSLDTARLMCLSVSGPGGRRLPVYVVARPAVLTALWDLLEPERAGLDLRKVGNIKGPRIATERHWLLAEAIECIEDDLRLLKARIHWYIQDGHGL